MSTVLSVIAALLVLTVFVVAHELGHYSVGRLFNFGILEFAVGMGPVLFKKTKNGIDYSLRAFPIGGMCRFYGEDEEPNDPRCFTAQKVWKRMLVVLAGPVVNLLLAVVLSAIILMSFGDYVPMVESLTAEDSPAAEAGVLPGDLLLSVDGRDIVYFNQVSSVVNKADSDSATLVVERDGERVALVLEDIYNAEEGRNMLGVMISAQRKVYGFFDAFGYSVQYVWSIVYETLAYFGGLIVGTVQMQSGDVVGPVGIVTMLSQAVRAGLEVVLRFGVLISASLGLMNLLPLPALDGGRFVFMVVEVIRGKPVPQKVEGMVHFVGILLLFALVIFLSVRDVASLIGG